MPTRPPRPCSHHRCPKLAHYPYGYCPDHIADAQDSGRQYDERRGPPNERGYDSKWKRVRLTKLSVDPFCEVCGVQATEVHHILPIADGGDHRQENLQSLCRACHNEITHGAKAKAKGARFILVYGPPASGNTTYVLQRKRESEPIIDLDLLFAALTGTDGHTHPAPLLDMAMQLHSEAIKAAARYCDGRVWVVATASTHAKRKRIMACIPDYEEVLMDTSASECLARTRNDPVRAERYAEWKEVIEQWFKEYQNDTQNR